MQSLYTFREGSGSTVTDVSGVGAPLNLTIANSGAVTWVSGGGLQVNSGGSTTIIESATAAAKVISAAKTSNEITVEAWIRPANTTQAGPARIVTISGDPSNRNVTLGQGYWGSTPTDLFNARLRTTTNNDNGDSPSVLTNSGTATTNLTHVVYTRDAAGNVQMYLNGSPVTVNQPVIGGNLSNWDSSYKLALADEFGSTGGRSWAGTYHLVGIYSKALSAAEVSQNYAAGANPGGSTATPTHTPPATTAATATNTPPATSTATAQPTTAATATPTAAASATATADPGSNLAPNPSFETDPNVDYRKHGEGSFAWTSAQAHSGSRSLSITQAAGTPFSTYSRWYSRTDLFTVNGDETGYTLSGWFKSQDTSGGSLKLVINYWDSGQGYISGETYSFTPNGNWQMFTAVTQNPIPANAAYARIEFRLHGAGTLWLDDISFTAQGVSQPTPTNTATATATVPPTATNTPLPANTPTATPSGPAVIQRSTYSLGGQAIALRVVEKAANGSTLSNKIYYYHTDHASALLSTSLGSTSVLTSHSTGSIVSGSLARYTPFGDWRTEPTADLTDRGFTGHKSNNTGANDLGLIYMNARFYVSGLNRFASADTIIPNPMNPQSLNRYSYVLNRPLNFSDPTGHRECGADCNDLLSPTGITFVKPFTSPYLKFSGLGLDRETKQMAHQAASAIAGRMAAEENSMRRFEARMNGDRSYTHITATEAFRGVFGGPITIHGANQACSVATDCRAWASLTETIISVGTEGVTNHYLFIHEMFHIFDYVILGQAGQSALSAIQTANANFPNRPDTGATFETWGFAGGNFSEWQKSRLGASDEEFADMGIGWTYNRWENSDYGKARANFMDVNMGIWLSQLLP